ncbi:MAG TPA: hypothetical protein VMZ91_04095 [Candidatus Paceibacterota bacterium]|nr:hypothetical protein [Candidatus Paceibacterota bacterium]
MIVEIDTENITEENLTICLNILSKADVIPDESTYMGIENNIQEGDF